VRQILGAVSQFEKAGLVAKLKHGRDAKRAATGRCEGRKPVPEAVVAEARRLARKSPKTGLRRSLRTIAAELARTGISGRRGSLTTPAASATCCRPERTLASAGGGNFAEHIVPPTGPEWRLKGGFAVRHRQGRALDRHSQDIRF
jgi:hypothetical protein